MKKIKLSPYVHKVNGRNNWLLVDFFQGKTFRVRPEGSVEDFQKQLIDNGLAYETEGVVPFKYETSLKRYTEEFRLRELQLRLTGNCREDCPDCGQICTCTKGDGEMIEGDVISLVIDQLKHIPVDHVLITGGNPFSRREAIDKIREKIPAEKYSLLFLGHVGEEDRKYMTAHGFHLISTANVNLNIKPGTMKIDAFSFFYHQQFNPCWGNKIAIDCDGSIKPCLWWNTSAGNIKNKVIKTMIAAGDFDKYWHLKKDEIDTCNICEYRYNCFDCRVYAFSETGSLKAKHPGCRYDPGESA